MDSFVATLDEEAATSEREFGAKAARLATLKRAGFPVPDGFAVTRGAFRSSVGAVLAASEWPSRMATGGLPDDASLAAIRARIVGRALDPALGRAIGEAY